MENINDLVEKVKHDAYALIILDKIDVSVEYADFTFYGDAPRWMVKDNRGEVLVQPYVGTLYQEAVRLLELRIRINKNAGKNDYNKKLNEYLDALYKEYGYPEEWKTYGY